MTAGKIVRSFCHSIPPLLCPAACILLLALTWKIDPARAQQTTLRGFVTNQSDGQAIELVNVVLQSENGSLLGATTNVDGLYLITDIAPGRYLLQASFVGYVSYRDSLTFAAGEKRVLNIALIPGEEELDEVLVESERTTGAARLSAGQQTVRPRDIELIPTPDVSGDLASLLPTLPSVVAIGDRGGQLFVRGGEPSQNLVQLDGVLLYQPFHILGFYSAFPSGILNRTNIYAGGFGSKYGERLSAVIDVSTRDGNKQNMAGSVTLSPFISGAHLEGPLIKDRLSFLVSARQSLVEEGAARIIDKPLPFDFGDLFVKLHGVVKNNARASAMVIRTHDRGTIAENTGGAPSEIVGWRNEAAGVRYLAVPNLIPLQADLRASISRLHTELGPQDDPLRTSSIQNIHMAVDLTFYDDVANVDAGASVRLLELSSELDGLYQNIEQKKESIEHVGIYAEPEFEFGPYWRLRTGLRMQFFDVKFNPFLEPRIRAVWSKGVHQFSSAIGLFHQTILGLNDRRDAANVFTVWTNIPRPRSDLNDIRAGRAQRAAHAIVGYRMTPSPWLEFSVEGFYKHYFNLFIAEWTAFPRLTTNLQPAKGRSFGIDLRAELRRRNVYGYVTYGFSNTRYQAQQAELILWYGQESLTFRPPHDRRHQLNTLISLTLAGFDMSARWEFGSGLPFSQAVGFDGFIPVNDIVRVSDVPGSRRVIYEQPFEATLPAYHRLDLSVSRAFPLRLATLTAQISVLNVYNRKNLFYLDVFTLRRVDQLPFTPSFGLKVDF